MDSNKMNRRVLYIILVIVLLALVTVGIIMYVQYSKGNDETEVEYEQKQVVYAGKIYYLPSDYKYTENYEEDGIEKLKIFHVGSDNWHAIVRVFDKSLLPVDASSFFDNLSSMEEYLKADGADVRNGQVLKYEDITYMIFEYYYEDMKGLIAYLPAYDDNWYVIRVVSGKVKNEKEELFFDYETFQRVLDVLNSAVEAE